MDGLKTNFGLQPLINKRAAIIGDARLDEKVRVLVERLLSISGEDGITLDRKGLEHWTGKLGVRFLILSNDPPAFVDASGAIASRFIVVRFRESFYGREDIALTRQLLTELPGILNWALVGLRRLQERGHFVQPASAAEMVEMMEDIASPIRKFIRECCELDAERSVDRDTLHTAYAEWCQANGHDHPMSKTKFGLALITAAPKVEARRLGPKGVQRWRCLGIRLDPVIARQRPPKDAHEGAAGDLSA
jgi:putative DNA primase/helicase